MNNVSPQSRTYFAHRFHACHGMQEKNPFPALFTREGNNPYKSEVIENGFQPLFEYEKSFSTGKNELAEASLIYSSSESSATEGSHCDNHALVETSYLVLKCHSETSDTKTFTLIGLDSQHFNYLPGQYLTISLEVDGKKCKRSYSLASTPTRPESFEITVKRDPNGGVASNWLNDNLKEGDLLIAKGPYGQFTCAKSAPSKILFLAAGSGIVPVMSMLRWLADTNAHTDVVLLLSFQTKYDIIYGDELNLIVDRYKNIKLFITLTKEPLIYSNWSGLVGRVNKKMITNCIPDVPERTVYLCGPDAFMLDIKQYLQTLGVPDEQLFNERFTVNTAPAPEQASMPNDSIGGPSRIQTGNYRIRFAKSGKTVTANGADNLLELAEKSGIAISHECRTGNCGECMVKSLKGDIEMTGQAEIDDIDKEKGWVYACCSYPVSDVVLDI